MRRQSITTRLTLVIAGAILIVLVAIITLSAYTTLQDLRAQSVSQARSVVQALGQDLVKIFLLDLPDVAADTIAELEAFPDIERMMYWRPDGEAAFQYQKAGLESADLIQIAVGEHHFTDEALHLRARVQYAGLEHGEVYLRVSTARLSAIMAKRLQSLAMLAPLIGILILAVAAGAQGFFSKPLLHLAKAIRSVSRDRDYGVRLAVRGNDEVAELFTGFNHLMASVEASERSLFTEKERLRVMLESITVGIITADADGRVEYVNPAAQSLTGWTQSQAGGQVLDTVMPVVDETSGKPIEHPAWQCIEARAPIEQADSALIMSRDGQTVSVENRAAPILGRDGEPAGVIMVFRDVSERRRMTRELAYFATHDALTGLANRYEFERRLDAVFSSMAERESSHCVAYLDLDQFKVVNDTCGHPAGDELLRQLCALLVQQVRSHDTFARLGGDEFGVILDSCSLEHAQRVTESLRRCVEEFRFVWEGRSFALGVSIGLVPVNDLQPNAASVLSAADAACYAAKEAGRNRVHVFDTDDADLARRQGEMEWVSQIREALDEDRFVLYRQPIKALHDSAGRHYEVLLRMCTNDGEHIAPGRFLPAAERYALMPRIDRWVTRTMLSWLAAHPDEVAELELCALNLSGGSLTDPGFTTFLIEQLAASGVPSEKLCFEITETVAISNLGQAIEFVRRLRELGCSIALDDFGSGMSSFTYLKNLPVDFVKIDGAFVQDACRDPVSRAMLRSINDIGHVMSKRTIAEFVEDDETLQLLIDCGVDYAQGYGVGRPQPLSDPWPAQVDDDDLISVVRPAIKAALS